MEEVRTAVIITAAGSGQRFGQGSDKLPKQFAPLNGEPILSHSLKAFLKLDCVVEMVLVVPSALVEYTNSEIIGKYGLQNLIIAVSGGKERQYSVENGFNALSANADVVLVHDGVRPFVKPEIIYSVITEASNSGASVCAVRATDTVKQSSGEQYIESTLNRDSIWLAQTPQGFRYDVLKEAFKRAREDQYLGTDESILVERIGVKVKLVPGSSHNIKITTKEDIIVSELLLKQGVIM